MAVERGAVPVHSKALHRGALVAITDVSCRGEDTRCGTEERSDAHQLIVRARVPGQSMTELNTADAIDARASRRFDLAQADRIDDTAYNRILWRAMKGPATPYPGARRMSVLDIARSR